MFWSVSDMPVVATPLNLIVLVSTLHITTPHYHFIITHLNNIYVAKQWHHTTKPIPTMVVPFSHTVGPSPTMHLAGTVAQPLTWTHRVQAVPVVLQAWTRGLRGLNTARILGCMELMVSSYQAVVLVVLVLIVVVVNTTPLLYTEN